MKRWLYLLHRWAGIALCIVMALWFFSGVVMMYVGYPKLTPLERLRHLPALALEDCCVSPSAALSAIGVQGAPDEMRLAMVAGAPRYLIRKGREQWFAVDARNGTAIASVGPEDALRAAREFAGEHRVTLIGSLREDAWTHSRALDTHRPLYRIAVPDVAGTEVYVSSRTGEVVRDSTTTERGWNWVGAWLHWLYMFRGNAFDAAWTDIVVYSSLAATLMAMLGTCIGILRWRVRDVYRKGGSHIPYREPWMRWHHILGLVFSVATILWIFSGLMSMNPWRVFTPSHAHHDSAAFAGGTLDPTAFSVSAQAAIARAIHDLGAVKELQWHWFDGKPWFIARDAFGRTLLLSGSGATASLTMFDFNALAAAAAKAMPAAAVKKVSVLREYDNWYIDRAPHTMLGHIEKRLPMLRVEFNDDANTWLQVDPYTGAIHNRIDNHARWKRWLFAAFHSWDLRGLVDRRPFWDVLMVGFSLGGFALCLTSIVIGWRRLRRKVRASWPLSSPNETPPMNDGRYDHPRHTV
jgi:uncharacterized iron-regulated membrane protein